MSRRRPPPPRDTGAREPDGREGGRPLSGGEERRLVARASRGDVESFSALVRVHSAQVRCLTLRMLGSQEAQDAGQEVWIRAWANIKTFRGDSAFATWLHRITVNVCLNVLRTKARQEAREAVVEVPLLLEPSGGDGDPEAAALGAERREELRAALGQVREDHRAALVLRHVQDLSYTEISEVLGVPDGTAKGWASRGRSAMAAALAKG